MKLKIKKYYGGDIYWFWSRLEFKSSECIVNFLFKEYKAVISDDFKKILLIDPIQINGIHGDKPKTLKYITINKWDVREVQKHCTGIDS